eukprot:TRINITY_DN16493_c0_g1_i1.p1 TRINITY_DN16493_c0_g1~~TRINITY_DN16493_c0_g1_i1.p1  ORF type:complete len:226 (-),score=35.01 TRINITY_DN16493_c0_g1_i1:986-1663(-)
MRRRPPRSTHCISSAASDVYKRQVSTQSTWDGFCIVSSDSDFTRLAIRLRESGMKVFGFGEQKTPNPFIVACDKFIYLEILKNSIKDTTSKASSSPAPEIIKQTSIHKVNKEIISLLSATVNDVADEDGWAFLGDVGNLIIKKRPDFDPRNYGYDKLPPLIKSLKNNFEIDERVTEIATIKHVYIRTKKQIQQLWKKLSVILKTRYQKQINPLPIFGVDCILRDY